LPVEPNSPLYGFAVNFQSLLTMTPPPELNIVPELATAWDVLEDGKTYVFHLVQAVTFHDGTAFDAQAAKWNFDRILTRGVCPRHDRDLARGACLRS
jgi:ABC-type transport system substrate-binding protein